MYCPRCGQQQVPDQIRFCSRCGFQLGLVAELIANNGFLPQLAALQNLKPSLFTRKNGVIFTVLWFIFWVMMLPAFFGIAGIETGAGVSAVFGVFSSVMLLVISLSFLKSETPKPQLLPMMQANDAAAHGLYGNKVRAALPNRESQPVSAFVPPQGAWRSPDTGEVVEPGSVTENTTKFFDTEKKTDQ